MTTSILSAISGNLENLAQLEGGKVRFINSADGAVSDFPASAILVINDAVITSLTAGDYVTGASKLPSLTLPAGLYVKMRVASIQLTSGIIALYA